MLKRLVDFIAAKILYKFSKNTKCRNSKYECSTVFHNVCGCRPSGSPSLETSIRAHHTGELLLCSIWRTGESIAVWLYVVKSSTVPLTISE